MPDNRIPTNQSQIDIKDAINALITALQSTKTVTDIIPITWSDFQNLTPAEKNANCWRVSGCPEPSIDVSKIVFDDELKSPSPYQTGCECVYIKRGKVVTYFAKITKPLASWTIFNYMPSPYGTPTEAIIGMCEVSGTFYPIILTNNGQFQVRTTPFNDTIYVSGSYLANE